MTVFTLSANVDGAIEIQEDGITLDGNGYTVDDNNGVKSGNGIYPNGRTGVAASAASPRVSAASLRIAHLVNSNSSGCLVPVLLLTGSARPTNHIHFRSTLCH
jgi:hypothetical protein